MKKYGELTLGQIEAIVNKLGGMDGVHRLLADDLEVVTKNRGLQGGDIFRLTIDYSLTLEQIIATGQYDWKNDDITAKRFPIKGDGIVEYEARYFHFNRNISSEDAVKEMEAAGWQPAKIEHALSHGKTFPDEQRKFPIIGLGSVAEVSCSRGVPCLRGSVSERRLGLDWWGDVWSPDYRFLAVRKVSVS